MVTQEEINKELKELKQQEQKAQGLIQQKIPVRRFGGNVRTAKARQQQVISQRKTGKEFLIQAQERRQELKQAQERLEEIKAQKRALAERRQAFTVAQRFAEKGGRGEVLVQGESALVREYFKQIKQGQEAQAFKFFQTKEQQIETLKEKGIPVTTISITELPAQELDPVRSIDTSKGPITLRGTQAFERPVQEVFKETFFPPNESNLLTDIQESVVATTFQFPKEQFREGKEEKRLTKKQIEDVEIINKIIEKTKTGETDEGIAIIPEKIFENIQPTLGIIEARGGRLDVLKERRETRQPSRLGKILTTKFLPGEEVKVEDKIIKGDALSFLKKDVTVVKEVKLSLGDIGATPVEAIEDLGKLVEEKTTRGVEKTRQFESFTRGSPPKVFDVSSKDLFRQTEAQETKPEEVGKIAGTLTTFSAFVVSPKLFLTSSFVRGTSKAIDPKLRFDERISGGTESIISGAFLGLAITKDIRAFSKKEVRIKLKSPEIQRITDSQQLRLEAGGRTIPLGKFNIKTVIPSQRYLITTRGELLRGNLGKVTFRKGRFDFISPSRRLSKLAIREEGYENFLKTILPKAVETRTSTRFILTQSAIFPVSKNQIINLVEKRMSFKRQEPLTFKILGGKTGEQKRLIDLLPKGKLQKLTPDIKDFAKKIRLGEGETRLFNILKVTKGGEIVIKPVGRRITRGQLTFIQKDFLKVTGKSTVLGRPADVGVKKFQEVIIGRDITFPRFKGKPNIIILKGEGTIRTVRFNTDFTKIFKGIKPKRVFSETGLTSSQLQSLAVKTKSITPEQQRNLFNKAIEKIIQSQDLKVQPAVTSVKSASLSATQEKTLISSASLIKSNVKEQQKSQLRSFTREQTKALTKTSTRELTKTLTKQSAREITRQATRQATRQLTRFDTKTLTKQSAREITRQSTRPTKPTKSELLFAFKLKKKGKKKGKRTPRFTDDIALVEGFTSKILKLAPVKIPKSQLGKFTKRFQTVGLRRKPIII